MIRENLRALESDPHSAGSRHLGQEQLAELQNQKKPVKIILDKISLHIFLEQKNLATN